jgi:hypothetical protein
MLTCPEPDGPLGQKRRQRHQPAEPRAVQALRRARLGGDGDGPSREAARLGRLLEDGGHQAPPPAVRKGRGVRRDVPRRGADGLAHPAPECGPAARRASRRRRGVPRHGVRRGGLSVASPEVDGLPAREGAPGDRRRRRFGHPPRAPRGARGEERQGGAARPGPSRCLATERARRRRRDTTRHRLRHRQGGRQRADDASSTSTPRRSSSGRRSRRSGSSTPTTSRPSSRTSCTARSSHRASSSPTSRRRSTRS